MRVTHWLLMAALPALAACDGKDKGGQAPATTAAPKSAAPATGAAPATAAPATEAAPATAAAPGTEGAAAAGGGAAADEAKQIFQSRCAPCHGAEGKGDGAAAASLPVKPRNYGDQEWQKTAQDAEIAKIIVEGGAAVGKSPLMPPNPDLKDKPEVVNALVAMIRAFGK